MENNTEPCYNCEKPVRTDRTYWGVHLNIYGAEVGDDVNPEEDLGWYPVGPECRRKYRGAEKIDPDATQ